jgi:hypothetical protein
VQAKQSIEDASKAQSLEDKERLLQAVKKNVDTIKGELQVLLKNSCSTKIQEIEQRMIKAKIERK